MRTQIIILLLFLAGGLGGPVSAQQWDGSSGTSDSIYRQGAVGVGVEAPDRLFHVNGDAVKFERSGTDSGLLIDVNRSDGSDLREWHVLVDEPTGNFFLRDATSPSNATRFLVDTKGRVGIGTERPRGKLDVRGEGPQLSLEGSDAYMDFRATGQVSRNWRLISQDADGSFRIQDRSAGAYRFVIKQSGKVGLGVTDPSVKLAVNGTTRTKEVIVESQGWPDYVFDEDYDLRSPAELSAYIEREGHLPALPSAATVRAEGQTVGEVQRGLVQTVEELARYAIDREEQVDSLTALVQEQRRALKEREGALNRLRERDHARRRRVEALERKYDRLREQVDLLRSDGEEGED
jgi:hypothetical protein